MVGGYRGGDRYPSAVSRFRQDRSHADRGRDRFDRADTRSTGRPARGAHGRQVFVGNVRIALYHHSFHNLCLVAIHLLLAGPKG